MQENEVLSLKTTNINVRISPILKSQLIEKGARMGISLSDFIGHVITKDMTGQNDPTLSDEYKDLAKKSQRQEAELARYEAILAPFKSWIGKDIPINGKNYRFEHSSEIMDYFVKSFNIKL